MSPKKQSRSTNPSLNSLIRLLQKRAKEDDAAIWKTTAELLSKPKRKRLTINLSKINRHTKENDEVVVPGKVLGAGLIDHPVKVAALDFSDQARSKIATAKGTCLSIAELAKSNPKAFKVKMIG